MPPLTRPALPWPPALCRPKTGTHHCRCIPPHDCPHNAAQNPSWCFPPVCLFCTRDFPGEHSIAQFGYHKKDFQRFLRIFCVKDSVCSPVCSRCPRPFSSEIRSLAVPAAPHFRRKQALELPFSVTTSSCENGIAERPQTLRYPEIKNIFSSDHAQSTRGGHSKSSRCASIILPRPSHGRGSLSAHSAPRSGNLRRRCR